MRTLQTATGLATISAVAVIGVGCQSPRTTAAHKIADALPRALGPAAHYDVRVEGDSFALARGRAKRIHVIGQEVQVAPGATLDMLDVDARGISFDPATRRLEHVNQAQFTGVVGQRNLDQYLAARHLVLSDFAVRLRTSDVLAELPISVPGFHTRASVSGTLAPDSDQPDHLDFVATAASVGSLDIPVRLVNGALSLLNPIFDLSHMKVPLTITTSAVTNSTIVLHGNANLDDFQSL